MRLISFAVIVALFNFPARTQTPQPAFEVASVKAAVSDKSVPSPGMFAMRGGPGTPDLEQLTYINVSLKALLLRAYDVKGYQTSGPSWLDNERYDIRAKIPPGTTKEQFSLMLQNLLTERFGMKVHHETRDVPAYELVVAKGGMKMRESASGADEPVGPDNSGGGGRVATQKDKNGLMELPPGRKGRMIFSLGQGRLRITARLQSITEILQMCESQAGRPITDKTGLTGAYDFNVDFSPNGQVGSAVEPSSGAPLSDIRDEGAPPFLTAIQSLGLKLESTKITMDVVVIDHIEKVPTEN